MRIRSLLLAGIAASILLGLAAAGVIAGAAREEAKTSAVQARAQKIAHDVSGLLVLTQEYARHVEVRAAQQWHQRHSAIASTLAESALQSALQPSLVELRATSLALPQLFSRLEDIAGGDDAFSRRRKDVLLDQLLTNTQAMSDHAYSWYQDAAAARHSAERRFQVVAFLMPVTMLVLLAGAGILVQFRVLAPLGRLTHATASVAEGDLTVRVGSRSNDELGTLSRHFDQMTSALAARNEELRRSERQLRAVTDNVPALIAYVDRDKIYRFANAHYKVVFDVEPETFVGQSIASLMGPAAYEGLEEHVDGALRGEHRSFERPGRAKGTRRHLLVNYIPDVAGDGEVAGFYVLGHDITARKNAELAQAQSENLLRLIADNLPTLIAYIDSGTRYRFLNGQYKNLLGVDPAGKIGMPVAEALGRELYAPLHSYLSAALGGERQVFERTVNLHGREVLMHTDYIPDHAEDGSVAGVFVMAADITDRKRAEMQVLASERRLRDITDHLPAMIGFFDTQERCLFANGTVLRLNGLSAEDVPAGTLRSGIGEEAYALHAPHIPHVLNGERRYFEGHVKRKGRDAYFQAHLVPARGEDGSIEGFYTMSFDVTAVRLAELASSRSEDRLRQITDNLPVLISYIDREHRLQFANATYQSWLGVDVEKSMGLHVAEVVGPAIYEQRRPQLARALSGERVEFELETQANGKARTTQTVYVPDIDPDGTVLGIYTMSTDVTALKDVERQLQSLARVDTLTGLPNRLQYNEKLPDALARAERSGDSVALMFLDIDRFKSINDTLGHAAGDLVLKEFARRLVASVRQTDTVARLAGDEFVIILEGLHSEAEPQFVARKILSQINRPFDVDGRALDVTTSVGIAYHASSHAPITASKLLAKADEALYGAKAAGRNTFCIA